MIEATKLNGKPIYINPHLIESIEKDGDTRIQFITGKTIIVKETIPEIIERIIKYRRKLGLNSQED